MQTFIDIVNGLSDIRSAAGAIEVKGVTNASGIVYITNKCNELIEAITVISKELEKTTKETEKKSEES